jgi:hypothetical protein
LIILCREGAGEATAVMACCAGVLQAADWRISADRDFRKVPRAPDPAMFHEDLDVAA